MKKEILLEVNIEDVLLTMECQKTSPNYNEYVQTCQHLLESHNESFKATGWLVLNGEERADCLVILDPVLEQEADRLFRTGEYLEGMMLNTIADYLLFDATEKFEKEAGVVLEKEGLYMIKKLEPGSSKVPIEEVVDVLDAVRKKYDIPVRLSEGYMMEPVKSSSCYYELTREKSKCIEGHVCERCNDHLCRYRKVVLTVIERMEERTHLVGTGANLLDALRRFGYTIEAPCGGKRLCNKCKVEKETKDGPVWIYACKTEIEEAMTIRLQNAEQGHVMADYHMEPVIEHKAAAKGKIAFAVDVGTTTMVVQCLDMDKHVLIDEERFYNPQRPYGADVISRIQHERENGGKILSRILRDKIREVVLRILVRQGKKETDISDIAIAGNTVMMYFLEGKDPYGLSVSPFTVENPDRKMTNGSILGFEGDIKVTLLPVISAYVGADIVAGFYASDIRKVQGNTLFIDIGTNGEIALSANGRVITASTAAGPAFEGANISCGTGSIDGAVCELDYFEGQWLFKTIANIHPKGFNGSALIDLMHICLQEGWVDETGRMECGDSVIVSLDGTDFEFASEDVRKLQLAKAAIAAGIKCLLEEGDITLDEVDRIFLAGGFGSHMNVEHAVKIGLLPDGAGSKVFVLGNSSLAGTVRFLFEENGEKEIDILASGCEYLELSMYSRFNDRFVDELLFS